MHGGPGEEAAEGAQPPVLLPHAQPRLEVVRDRHPAAPARAAGRGVRLLPRAPRAGYRGGRHEHPGHAQVQGAGDLLEEDLRPQIHLPVRREALQGSHGRIPQSHRGVPLAEEGVSGSHRRHHQAHGRGYEQFHQARGGHPGGLGRVLPLRRRAGGHRPLQPVGQLHARR